MLHARPVLWAAFLCGVLVLPARSSAQVASGEITGVIADSTGAAVPGATVRVINLGTQEARVVVSNERGVYSAAALLPGRYRIDVTLKGFSTVQRDALQLTTGQTVRLDVRLTAGGITEAVTVTSGTPMLRTESAGLGVAVEQVQVRSCR